MNWIVTGSGGQLGRALCAQLAADPADALVAAPDRGALDVADGPAVEAFFQGLAGRPDVVVNAAAFTHVDRCESEPEQAERVNAVAPGLLARACATRGTRFVHVSTDYVFPGDGSRPYREEDPTGPRSAYGRTKLRGEERVREADPGALVVRTSWVFGHGRNFIGAILGQVEARRRGEARGPLRVVADQRGRPTWARDLAEGIRGLVAGDARGVYHLANDGEATWWDLARFCCDAAGAPELEIEPLASGQLDLPAPRPAYSVLDCGRAAARGVRLRDWRGAVRAYLASDASPLAAPTAAGPAAGAPRRAGAG